MADPVVQDEADDVGSMISNAGPPIDPTPEVNPPPAANGNAETAPKPNPKNTRVIPPNAQPTPEDTGTEGLPPNEVAAALTQVLGLRGLDPHMAEMLRNARLRPSKDGQALLIDLPHNGHCLHCGKLKDGSEFIGMPHKKMIVDEHDAHIMIGLAKGRGWKAVNVTGTPKEQELIWLEAMRQGLGVANFQPDPNSEVAKKWAEEFMNQPQPSVTEAKPEDFHLKTMQMLQTATEGANDKDVKAGVEGILKIFQDGTAIHGTPEIFKGVLAALTSDKDERKAFNAAVEFLNKTEPKLALKALDPAPPAAAPVAQPAATTAKPEVVTPP